MNRTVVSGKKSNKIETTATALLSSRATRAKVAAI